MRAVRLTRHRPEASGFSMIEMLLTAFILAVGILGLALLQTMSLRAVGGSKNLTMAVQLAEQMMDQVEQEGRLTYNNAAPGSGFATAPTLTGLQFYNQAAVDRYFSVDPSSGNVITSAAPGQFQLHMAQTVVAGVGLSDVAITVTFADGPKTRTATITRRILHG